MPDTPDPVATPTPAPPVPVAPPVATPKLSPAQRLTARLATLGPIWKHAKDWAEAYWWLPLTLLAVIGAGKYVKMLTGRASQEGVDWIPGFAVRAVACILIVIFISITKQQTGVWLNKEEQLLLRKTHWQEGAMDKLKTIVFALLFAYVLLH